MAKAYYGLRHHTSIDKMVRKHVRIIPFGAQTKKRRFEGVDPAGMAGSQTGQAGLGKFPKCKIRLHYCISLVKLIQKNIYGSLYLESGPNKYDFLEA
jgi:hypothetical protein